MRQNAVVHSPFLTQGDAQVKLTMHHHHQLAMTINPENQLSNQRTTRAASCAWKHLDRHAKEL